MVMRRNLTCGMVVTMQLNEWLRTFTDDSINKIAAKIGMDQSALNRQVNGQAKTSAELTLRLARAYKINPVDALVALGFLAPHEAKTYTAKFSIQEVRDQDLLDEMERRLRQRGEWVD